jgi:hypothetical protein
MVTRVHPPACLLEVFDDYLFPTIDFSQVSFYTGMPFLLGDLGSQDGLTLPAPGFTSQIHVYLRESAYNPCGFDRAAFESFLLIAHELVHVLQIQQSFLGGWIPGWSVGKYVGCWLGWLGNGTGCDNSLEREAYEWANGCPPTQSGGVLRSCLTNSLGLPNQPTLNQSPCDCSDAPWYRRSLVPGTTVTFYDELPRVCPGDVKRDSEAESWKCLLSPWALIAALIVGAVWGVGSVILQGYRAIKGWVGGLFGDSKSWIWFTAFDGTDDEWFIPDVPVTKNGHTKTSAGPALAVYNGLLYMAYKSSGDDTIWYNVFDGNDWWQQDQQISAGGHTLTSAAPALAVYNGQLMMVYRSSGDDTIWGNEFQANGNFWPTQDHQISAGGHTLTSAAPALAVYNGLLYMAYKSSGDDGHIWYNYFDGRKWLDQDIPITQHDHTKTSAGPALAVYNGLLYMAYKSSGDDDIWYNTFNGQSWNSQDSPITRYGSVYTGRAPALAGFGKLLYLTYRDNS